MTGLSHVQLSVSNVRASADWYAVALGLERYVEDPDIGYVALRHRDSRIVIVLTAEAGVAVTPDDGPEVSRDAVHPASQRLDHLAFAVADGDALRSWARHLTESGIEHPGVILENGNPSLQLTDPDGIAIELVAPGTSSDASPKTPV